MSLKKQVIKSFLWNGLAGAMCEAMNLITSLLLARLLFPGDFGLMGMALFLIGFVSFFAEFGLIAALIQKKDLNDDTLSSLFWSTALTSALLYVLVYAGAPFYAAFYNEPRLTLIIRILFIDFLLYPISMIQYSMHIKKMNFKLVSIANIVTTLISGAVVVIMAFKGFGIWSLIAQPLLVRVSSTLFFWFSTEWRPRFELVFHKIKELYFFGMKKLLVNLVNFTLSNIDFFLIGKFLGAYALGLYTLAFRIMKAPFNKIAAVINGVLFPAYSVIQDDVVRFNKNYLRSTTAISCIIVPILIFISFNSKEIILLLFGEKWIASAPILMILCCAEMVEIFSFSDQSAIIAKGEPAYLVKINLIILFFIGAGIYLGSRYGIIVVASVYTVSIAIGSSVKKAIVLRKLGISFKNFYFSIRPIIISSVFIILSLLISGPLADRYLSISALMRLLVSGAVCAFVYCVLLFMTNIVRMENGKINLII